MSILIAGASWYGVLPVRAPVFALVGALHALSLLAAARAPVPWSRRVLMVVLAAALCFLTYRVGLLLHGAVIEILGGPEAAYLALGCAAGLGALSYGLMLRRVLEVRLTAGALCLIASGCVLASYLAAYTARSAGLGVWWPVVGWWFAFSGGLSFSKSQRPRSGLRDSPAT